MEKFISIIVPVYNVEKYLEKCLNSILSQDYRGYEVLLIDDGSTDNSPMICDDFSRKYNNIRVIHKTNGGLSAARNIGIKEAKGEYVFFVDSDDSLYSNALSCLVEPLQNEIIDIVIGCINLEYDDGSIVPEENVFNQRGLVDKIIAIRRLFQGSGYSACGKLFRKSLFDKITFPEGKIDEDYATMYKVYYEANSIFYTNEYIYRYFKREGSITKSTFNVKKLDFVYNAREAYHFSKNLIKDKMATKNAFAYYCIRINRIIGQIENSKDKSLYKKEEKYLQDQIKKNCFNILFTNCLSIKDKMVILSRTINPALYEKYKQLSEG